MQRITIITIPANDLIDVTDFPYNNSNDMKKAEEKFGKNNKVHTILCGGKELERISLDPKVVEIEEELKIANGKATMSHTIDTVKFFMEKRHKRVKNVILQISTNHIEKGQSET